LPSESITNDGFTTKTTIKLSKGIADKDVSGVFADLTG
jgi:hypothetical protein